MDIKQLLIERNEMSLTDLARHFYVSENVMQSMLAQWIKKGKVKKRQVSGLCSSTCGSCDESAEVKTLYQWKSVAQKPIHMQVK
ncbi:FeoC-like transcriptional regulator [Aliikangiella sp. IMCC44653]